MKELEQSFELIEQPSGYEGINKIIEICGRTPYKSEDKITETSSADFVGKMIKSKHLAMVEFGTYYFTYPKSYADKSFADMVQKMLSNAYVRYTEDEDFYYITTNGRAMVENHWQSMIHFLTKDNKPTKNHKQRYCIKMTTCRKVTHEAVRHRGKWGNNAFAQESTRFCLYLKNKFGGEICFIKPTWLDNEEENIKPKQSWFSKIKNRIKAHWNARQDLSIMSNAEVYHFALQTLENAYMELCNRGWSAQKGAMLLPNSTKAEICICMYLDDWKHFFNLRTSIIHKTGMPDPMMYDIADKIYLVFKEKGLIS